MHLTAAPMSDGSGSIRGLVSRDGSDSIRGLVSRDGSGSIRGLVSRGHDFLNRHDLVEAEDAFHAALEQSASISASSGEHGHLLRALQGLAEVYVKRARRARHNDLEHHRMYLHALTAKRRAIECCSEALCFNYDNRQLEHFSEEMVKITTQLETLENNIVKTLKRKVLKDARRKESKTGLEMFGCDSLDISWLQGFQDYYIQKCNTFYRNRYESLDDISQIGEEVEEVEPPPPPEKPKPINFENLQKAIQKIVKKIAQAGTLKIHKDMTPDQKLNLISPLHGDMDIFKTFSRALNGDDMSDSSKEDALSEINEEFEQGAQETLDIIECSRVQSPDDDVFEESSESDIPKTINLNKRASIPFMLTPLPFHHIESDSHYLIGTCRAPISYDKPTGVYRIWRTSSSAPDPLPEDPYTLQTFEEISPLTKFIGFTFKQQQKEDDLESVSEEHARFPISASRLNISLAMSLCKMAGVLSKESRYSESCEVYKHALGVLRSTPGHRENLLEPMGFILQQLGLVKCKHGDFVGGSNLVEESIALYERSDPEHSGLFIARAWYKLGNAYIRGQHKENNLIEHVMKTVQEALLVEYKADLEDVDDVSDTDSECSEGEDYSIATQEASVCFDNALRILRKLEPSGEKHNKLLVEVLTKTGDCHIMAGNYDAATDHYEEAVGLFKNIVGSATLQNNAHVLSMLATANFLLNNYPKAISMYECSHLLQSHLHDVDNSTFSMAFTLTMLGICYRQLGHYHKCVSWCIRAFEIYSQLYKESIMNIDCLHRWFVTETLYTLGISYGTLSLHDKSLYYLKLSRNMLKNILSMDTKQCVRVLKAMGDQYVAIEDNENGLKYYTEALELVAVLGMERGTMTLQNQLLNCMAGVHVSNKQYGTAAEYLEQALGYQKTMETTMHDDMSEILRQLSKTYTMSGDIERAIECCQECVEAYSEQPNQPPGLLAEVLARLGTLYHVKACIQDDNEEMLELLDLGETHYCEAVDKSPDSSACVQYANYLFQQAQYAEALLAMLQVVHCPYTGDEATVCYSGVEQAVLPENLQPELDDLDQVHIDTQVFARFLALLCYRQLHLIEDAWDCLIDLTRSITPSQIPLNHSILGYAMLEMGMYFEAARSFAQAFLIQHDNSLPALNCWLSVGLGLYSQLASAMRNIYEHTNKEQIYQEMLDSLPLLPPSYRLPKLSEADLRDSGCYETLEEVEEQCTDLRSDNATHENATQQTSISYHGSNLEYDLNAKYGDFSDKGYYSSEYIERQGLDGTDGSIRDNWHSASWHSSQRTDIPEEHKNNTSYGTSNYNKDEWVTTVEVEEVETPQVILQALQNQRNEQLREINSSFIDSSSTINRPISSWQKQHSPREPTPPPREPTPPPSPREPTPPLRTPTPPLELAPPWLPTSPSTSPQMGSKRSLSKASLSPVVKRSPGKTWTETYEELRLQRESESSNVVNEEEYTKNNPAVTIEYETETVNQPEVEWVVEEVEVETPAVILEEMRRRSMDLGTQSLSLFNEGHVSPMQISPDVETVPAQPSPWSAQTRQSESWNNWSSRTRSEGHYNRPTSLATTRTYESSYQSNRVDNRDVNPSSETETTWVSEETVETPTAIIEAINNNGHSTHLSHSSPISSSPPSYRSRYGNYHTESRTPYYGYRGHTTDTGTDIKNGNHVSSHSRSYRQHNTASPAREETWQTTEETVDTPPEILQAILRAQRTH